VKPFEPFAYEGFDLPDPFKPRKLSAPKEGAGGGVAPDLNRRKEPLEAFPLEQLKMVGTLSQNKETYALVRADKTLYRVKKGNYMGQNFGLITDVTESEIKLKEIVQDSAGDWAERQSVLPLLEEAGKGDKK
jgi:type IV pilus assembly protein PilP